MHWHREHPWNLCKDSGLFIITTRESKIVTVRSEKDLVYKQLKTATVKCQPYILG